MIVDEPESHFIFVWHPAIYDGEPYTVFDGKPMTNAQVLKYWGKWLVLGDKPRLDVLAARLDPYVEARRIPCIKYDRAPSKNLGMDECVMMVYCDFRKRDEVWAILASHGVRLKAFVTERETMELWMPGGPLLERFMEEKGMDPATREAIRDDARKRLSTVFDNPDVEFSPWAQ